MARKDSLIGVIVLVAVVIGLFFFFGQDGEVPVFATVAEPLTIDFAGFTWTSTNTCGSFSVQKDGEFLVLKSTNGFGTLETDVTDVDEFLVIFEGTLYASCGGSSGQNSASGIGGSIVGTEGGSVGDGASISTDECQNSVGDTANRIVEPAIWKLRNNFDGTWSSLTSIGVGDIFIVKATSEIRGTPMLRLSVSGSAPPPCGGQEDTWSNTQLRIFNVVRKEAGFAICKADEFIQDVNQDGIITPDECFDLATIVLNSEEAIKESFDAKLARIELELLAKNQGLSDELEALKLLQNTTAQQERLLKLELELSNTILLLQKLQDREQDLLDAIKTNEKITIINQTIFVIQPIVEEGIIIEQPVIIGEEEKGIPVWVKVIFGFAGIFILLKIMRFI